MRAGTGKVFSYIAEAGGASMFAPMNTSSLDSLMSPVADCLDRPSLEALVNLRASPDAAMVMHRLAERANEGLLTDEERREYESCILFTNFLGILQSKARRRLAAGV